LEAIGAGLLITYVVGLFAGLFVLPWRVGLNRFAWGVAFMHPGSRRNGIPWAVTAYVKTLVWPAVFALWLANGRPPSRVLYGAEAAEQLYGDPDRALPGFMTKWKAS
jgi:hypothetical protein